MDLKLKIGGRIGTILMCVKFGDDPISSLDFSFSVPLTENTALKNCILLAEQRAL